MILIAPFLRQRGQSKSLAAGGTAHIPVMKEAAKKIIQVRRIGDDVVEPADGRLAPPQH